jgi:U3 small nucleolar RNA-associated protein 11
VLATTQRLKRKAEERNPDEFYFAMEKARTKNGIHDGRLVQQRKGWSLLSF